MVSKSTSALLAVALLAAAPAYAEHHGGMGGGGGHAGGPGPGGHAMPGGAGGRPSGGGSGDWGQFQHHEPFSRVNPHRFGGSVFPVPNRWHGDVNRFENDRWHGGGWHHLSHNGRWGWWWVVGPDWYFYDEPVYPYPDSYTPPGEMPGWWYWCDAYQEYYPYVTFCPGGWQRVLPRD